MLSSLFMLPTLVAPIINPTILSAPIPSKVDSQSPLRQKININREWRFLLGDAPGAQDYNFSDAPWQSVGLPHSFSLPYFQSSKFYVGYGWYRKHVAVPKQWKGQHIFLQFEGVFQDAEVFVNGTPVGRHRGGYTGFSLDITRAVHPGDNVIAVRVNNLWNARLAPRAGEHVFSGGIYRNVYLTVTAPLHVAWYGTFVSTPNLSSQKGTVDVQTEVRNETVVSKKCRLQTEIYAPDGKVVARLNSTQVVPAKTTTTFKQVSQPVPHPKLWHPDTPTLYRAKTTVFDADKPVDHYETPFGFRWFRWTADKGFFLNGEHYYFKGANVHQDHAGWGDAVTNAAAERDVHQIKEAGFNFIRGSHYPHAPAFTDACDRLGMLFWSENVLWGIGGFERDGYWNSSAYPPRAEDQPEFEESVRQQLREMIRIHRNHPSIVVWSMSNEPFFTAPDMLPKLRTFLQELVSLSHELDPTRPAAIGGAQRGEIDMLGDIAGYNGDGARLFIAPPVANVVSEYGSTITNRPGKYEPDWGDLPAGPDQDKSQLYPWRYSWRSGEVIWCGFDHGSIAGSMALMGMVDYFRLPKRQWYWYRNTYRHIPPPMWPEEGTPTALRLSTDKTILRSTDGTDDTHLVVTVVDAQGKAISNSPPVTLTVESGPGEFPTGSSITFAPDSDIAIRDGQAAIEFRSYYGGRSQIRATSPGLKDAVITITTQGEPVFVPGKTPATPDRPYVRFTGDIPASQPASTSVDVAALRPTRASSEAAGHTGRLANDRNSATFWQARGTASEAWWQVALENRYLVTGVALTFPDSGSYQYKVEISKDGTTWKTLSNQSATIPSGQRHIVTVSEEATGNYIRVVFLKTPEGKPAAISAAEVFGKPAMQ